MDPKSDNRPQYGAWAPGSYMNKCASCGELYVGDKRSVSCADCAYGTKQMCVPAIHTGKYDETIISNIKLENSEIMRLVMKACKGHENPAFVLERIALIRDLLNKFPSAVIKKTEQE